MSDSRELDGPSDPGPRGSRRAWAELLGSGARGPREWAALGSETTSRSSLGRPDPGRPGFSACRLPSARWAPTPDPPNSGPRPLLVPSTSCPQAPCPPDPRPYPLLVPSQRRSLSNVRLRKTVLRSEDLRFTPRVGPGALGD